MHIHCKALISVVLLAFSLTVRADDVVSSVEQNFPYQEVNESYGVAKIQEGRCREGTPFPISQKGFQSSATVDVAKRIHERLRSLGANAFSMIDVQEGAYAGSLMVTPLTCELR